MLWWMWMACGSKSLDFGNDQPTDLSGEVDTATLHPMCFGGDELIASTPSTGDFRDFKDEGFTRYTSIVAPNGGSFPSLPKERSVLRNCSGRAICCDFF